VIFIVRFALYVVLFFMLLSVVVALGSAFTGPFEKIALIAVAGVLIWLATFVRRVGTRSPSRLS
jgi:hypothetical protein